MLLAAELSSYADFDPDKVSLSSGNSYAAVGVDDADESIYIAARPIRFGRSDLVASEQQAAPQSSTVATSSASSAQLPVSDPRGRNWNEEYQVRTYVCVSHCLSVCFACVCVSVVWQYLSLLRHP